MYKNNSFRHNVSGIGFDPAFVNTALNLNVAGETPSGAPWIAGDPIVNSVEICPPSDDDKSVIDKHSITLRIAVQLYTPSLYRRNSFLKCSIDYRWWRLYTYILIVEKGVSLQQRKPLLEDRIFAELLAWPQDYSLGLN